MALIDLDICNLAIDRVAGDRIDALGEDTPLGVFCADNYPHKRDYVMGKYRWTFANRVRPLALKEIAAGETAPMVKKFVKPSDLVGAVHAFRDAADPQRATRTPYVMESDGHFWADDAPLFAEYTAARAEAEWPVWFRQLVITAFAADLADHCQNRGLARDLRVEAWGTPAMDGEGGLYAQARNEDARHAPQRQLAGGVDPGPLVGVRGGGRGSSLFGY